jgi:hypothetical protein
MFHFEYFIYVSCYMHVPIFEIKKSVKRKNMEMKNQELYKYIYLYRPLLFISRGRWMIVPWKQLKMVIVNYLSMDEILIKVY